MKGKILLILSALILIYSCNEKQIGIVQVTSVLLVRENPSPNAKILDKLSNGALIYIYNGYPNATYVINGVKGNYCYIEYNNITGNPKFGYAFDAYIKRQTSTPMIVLSIAILLIILAIFTVLILNKKLRQMLYDNVILKIGHFFKNISDQVNNYNSKHEEAGTEIVQVESAKEKIASTPKKLKVFLISVVILIIIIIAVIKSPIATNTIVKYLFPPSPIVVSSEADDLNSSIFDLDYKNQLNIEIRNDGGDGYILLEVTLKQNNRNWTKSKTEYFSSRDTKRMNIEFGEVKLLGENPEIEYRVSAFSK